MRGISVWREGIRRRRGQFRLKAFSGATAAFLGPRRPEGSPFPPSRRRDCEHGSPPRCLPETSFRPMFGFLPRFIFRRDDDRRGPVTRWPAVQPPIDSVHVAGLNFSQNAMHTKRSPTSVSNRFFFFARLGRFRCETGGNWNRRTSPAFCVLMVSRGRG